MEDSTENTKELLVGNDVAHRPFLLPFFNSILEVMITIFRLLGSYGHRPISSSPEDSYTGGSYPPPIAGDPPVDDSGQGQGRFNPPPPPPPSNGGGGQINLFPSDPNDE